MANEAIPAYLLGGCIHMMEAVMPIAGEGWEMHIVRQIEQGRGRGRSERRRTVGTYQVFHNGVAQPGDDMSGMVAESKGPGANSPRRNGKRVAEGRYPLFTQDGEKYVTFGFADSTSSTVLPKPGFELKSTGDRAEILVHPGVGFLSSIGCINPCTSLPDSDENITFKSSRRRVISLIEDMKSFIGGAFPDSNGESIPGAFVVIDGEP
jgi:hypothetical protein